MGQPTGFTQNRSIGNEFWTQICNMFRNAILIWGGGHCCCRPVLVKLSLKEKPNFADAHSNLGNILKDLGKLKEAELSTRKAIEINPNHANAYYTLGIILSDLGKLKEARLCSEKIMSLRSWSILGSYSFNREMKLD